MWYSPAMSSKRTLSQTSRPIPFSSREEVIWAAGFFEGEGWITIQGNSPAIGIQNTDLDALEKMQKILGCGSIYYRPPRIYSYEIIKTRKEQWAWRVGNFEQVQAALVYMWPWLSERRKERAKEVLLAARIGKPRTRKVNGETKGPQRVSSRNDHTINL